MFENSKTTNLFHELKDVLLDFEKEKPLVPMRIVFDSSSDSSNLPNPLVKSNMGHLSHFNKIKKFLLFI
jgi:hypothetical protein